ncbi:MAG: MBL fold metallo-hydrolase, partial [Chlamydiia bacterium]|nr:MBL fold metallo-hydrolase [Chlamydiia bacterium]
PGHTPEHIAYLVTDAKARSPMGIITGDFLFVGDLGRPDLLEKAAKIDNTAEASAKALFSSAQNLLGWGDRDHLLVWPAHGAGSACGKGLGAVPHSSLGYERLQNPALAKVREGQKAFVDHILSGQPEPPLYFARMKALNRDGVPLLPKLPEPRRLSVQELGTVIEEGRLLPVDAREAKLDFLSRHLPGSLFAPFSSNFSTVVGSLVEDPSAPILLVIESDHEEEAIRRLVRIGYDQIEAVVHLDTLARYFFEGGKSASIPTIDFAQAEQLRKKGAAVVDLRFKHEYDSGHVPGAIHAPYTRLPELLKDIPASSQIVAHCHAGLRAAVSSAYLQRKGFKVSAVNDHIDHYKEIRD